MAEPKRYIGLDIGGTKCAAVVGDGAGQVLHRVQWASDAQRGPQQMIEQICTQAQRLINEIPPIIAIGVSIGGPLDAEAGIILSPPNLPGWDRIPLKQILANRLKLPLKLEHDAAACCLAEYRWGAGQGTSRLVYLTCGTGFGAGLVVDGKIYRGAGGKSLEIGHARFRDDGPEAFGKRGSVEAYCAGASLGKLAAWRFPQRWTAPPVAEELANIWKTGDAQASEIIELNAAAVGEVCANIADFLRPDAILLGSLAIHLGSQWVQMVRKRFDDEVLPDTNCRIEPAGLAEQLQDCSALAVATA
jgi:glucokinase